MMRRTLGSAAAAVAALALGLSGCVAAPSPFDGKRLDDDRLPAGVAQYVTGGDVTTSRYQGTSGIWDIYLVHGTGHGGFCLAYTDGTAERSGASCTPGTWLGVELSDGAEFQANVSGFVEPLHTGEVELSTWVRQVTPGRQPITSGTL